MTSNTLEEYRKQWAEEQTRVVARFGRRPSKIARILEENDRLVLVEMYAGTDIQDACREASELSMAIEKPIQFDFNGITMTAGDGSAKAMVDYYHNPETHRRL